MTRPQWEFGLALERGSNRPLFLQIASAIAEDICRGRLKPGDALPGSRVLAKSLRVNRVTVLTAYDELAAEGWIVTERAKGVRVSEQIPESSIAGADPERAPRGLAPRIYRVPPAPSVHRWPAPRPGMLLLNSWPDSRLVRIEPLVRAYRRVLRSRGKHLLAYGDPLGHPALRAAIAQMLATSRGLAVTAENVMITRGSQMGLTLVARGLLGPDRAIAVEGVGYPHAWHAFTLAGAVVVPVPVDSEGLDVAALARIAESRSIDAVYVTPHHQFPTTVTLCASRRAQLLDLARSHRWLVIEDDYDDAFHFEGRPVLPLASLDRAGVVIYLGTLSKVFAPGIRMGYVVAPADVLDQLAAHRQFIDVHGDAAIEAAVAELLNESEVQRHVRRVKRIYHSRRDLLADLLRGMPGAPLSFDVPAGGTALWVRMAASRDVDEWASAALTQGVAILTARTFAFDGRRRPFARIGYAYVNEPEIRLAVERLTAALPSPRRNRKS
jgi:GntR family transcriptional regulator/MocR family aminotransferase